MCDCIDRVNDELAKKSNTALVVPVLIDRMGGIGSQRQVMIATQKRISSDKRKPMNIFATYCPFCGQKYSK
jgi:hypothetical protein